MTPLKDKKHEDYSVEFVTKNDEKTDIEQFNRLRKIAKKAAKERTPERKLRNEILSIQYRIEEYLKQKELKEDEIQTIEMFLKEYLVALNLSLKHFSIAIDTTDSNLKKYLTGERSFNIDLAMKFGHFFHTSPELWLNLATKNTLMELFNKKNISQQYKKYDFEKLEYLTAH